MPRSATATSARRPGRRLAPLLLCVLGALGARPAAGDAGTPAGAGDPTAPAAPAGAAAPAAAPASAAAPAAVAVAGALDVTPPRVPLGLFYAGATLDVRARVPAGWGAAAILQSPRGRLTLKRKGKRAGILWMKVGEVTFEDVPTVYQAVTTAPLAALAGEAELRRWRLGYAALVPAGRPEAAWRDELVKLRTHEGCFAMHPGELRPADERGAAPAGAPRLLAGSFRLPAAAPPGDYTVELVAFRDGRGVRLGTASVHLETVGAVRALRGLALGHGLLYGVVAVVVAILVGLLTGLVFRPRSGEAH